VEVPGSDPGGWRFESVHGYSAEREPQPHARVVTDDALRHPERFEPGDRAGGVRDVEAADERADVDEDDDGGTRRIGDGVPEGGCGPERAAGPAERLLRDADHV